MTVQLAAQEDASEPPARRFRLPEVLPPFSKTTHRIFTVFWIAALLLALIAPAMGLYQRYSTPGNNSQLMLGSRAGLAVSSSDATKIRFTIGDETARAGIKPGDVIVGVYGLPLPDVMPMTNAVIDAKADDPAYIAMSNVLLGTEPMEVPLTIRSGSDGRIRDVTLMTGEHHINSAVTEHGLTSTMLGFVDLVHVIFYPLLLWAAWILHRRNSRDAVSSILSLAILLIISSEQPASAFLAGVGVPRTVNVLLYDLGQICLLTGILLFPHGRLSRPLIILLATLPVLMLLHGTTYQAVFFMFMLLAVLLLIRGFRSSEASDMRQQIRWALLGFSGYAFFRIVSIGADLYKAYTDSFPTQLAFEVTAGLSLGLAMLVLQLGLLIALLRFRLYDAESIISRTASVTIVTLVLGAVAAGVMEGIITQFQNVYEGGQTPAAVVGAVLATMFIHPLHERVQRWAERRFRKDLTALRDGLPEAMRDLRDVASVEDFLSDVLKRVTEGVKATKAAVMVGREVRHTLGVSSAEVLRWLVTHDPEGEKLLECAPKDKLFPVRVVLESSSTGINFGWLLVGTRPDGSIPGKDEQEVLEAIAPALSRSIRIALNREKRETEFNALMQTYTFRIERIEGLLKI